VEWTIGRNGDVAILFGGCQHRVAMGAMAVDDAIGAAHWLVLPLQDRPPVGIPAPDLVFSYCMTAVAVPTVSNKPTPVTMAVFALAQAMACNAP